MRVDVDAGELDQMAEDFKEAARRAADLTPVTKPAAERLRGIITLSFAKSKSPNEEPWRPLADTTIARRRKGSSKPLIDTGLLRTSIATRGESKAVVFGVSGPAASYAPYHQFGTRKIPRRAFLPVDQSGTPQFEAGSARKWIARTMTDVLKYIAGKTTGVAGYGNRGGAGGL